MTSIARTGRGSDCAVTAFGRRRSRGRFLEPAMRPPGILIEAERGAKGLPWLLCGPAPAQLVNMLLRDLDAVVGGSKPGERAVQHDLVPALAERGGEDGPAAQALDVPRGRLGRNLLEGAIPRQDGRGRLRAPAGQARVAIGRVAD